MFANSFQGISPFSPVGYGHVWKHPGFYPSYPGSGQGHFGYYPDYNYGNGYQWNNEYYQHQEQHEAQSQHKHHQPHVKSHNYEHQSHHGYPFGQGSGQFPDYYNHNY